MTSAEALSPANSTPKNEELSGIIYPPPDIRKIIDTTSSHVAKGGIQLEQMLKENNKAHSKLSFLYSTDPYHTYYQHMVSKFRSGEATLEKQEVSTPETKYVPEPVKEKLPPKRPPPFEFMSDLPAISAQDLDILKLTAQFVARNGRPFLHTISAKEQRNFQFDFLKPTHSLFNYFMKLVEQYSNVIKPPTQLLERLKINSDEPFKVLDRVNERVEFTLYEDEVRKKQAEKEEKDRALYASIDWHDFVVVQTLEFNDEDKNIEFPMPTTLKELESMTLAQKKSSIINELVSKDEDQVVDMEVDMEDEYDQPPQLHRDEQAKVPDYSGPVKIKRDYVPKVKQGTKVQETTHLCPYCNLPFPDSEIEEHIKIELLDPKHKIQREISESRNRKTNLVNSSETWTKNLGRIAERRPDIFDTPEEIARNRLREDEDRRRRLEKERPSWDGHSQKLPTGANPNAKYGGSGHTVDDQIDAIHRKSGLTAPEANSGPHYIPPHGMPPAGYHMQHQGYSHPPPPPHYMPPPPSGYGHPPPPPPPHQQHPPYPPHLQQPPAPPEQDPNQKKQRQS